MSIKRDSSTEESLQGSWVELHYGTSSQGTISPQGTGGRDQISSMQVDLEKLLLDAQHESGRSSSKGSSKGSSQCNSPPRSQTPLHLFRGSEANSSQSEEDYQERRQEVDSLMKKNADWIWDWSSRPENNPPKEFRLKHRRRSGNLSIRNTSVMKKGGVLSPDFLKLIMPSLIISHIMAVGLGIYFGRRFATHTAY